MNPASHYPESETSTAEKEAECFDVIVIGGALSGASTALLLAREHPGKRILVIERSKTFGRRVGEATVEISTYFLTRVLGLTEYLNQEHLNKQGLRFWFYRDEGDDSNRVSELGPGYNVRFPSYQVDRAKLDEEVLRRARTEGVTIYRPAEVKEVEWRAGRESTVTFEKDGMRLQACARWIVDASGAARLMARKNRWVVPNTRHPISSMWSRWKGVRCLDDRSFRQSHSRMASWGVGTRFTATNHLIGPGWWSWWIPLKGGEVSVGVVWDERMTDSGQGSSIADKLRHHLGRHPLGRDLLEGAEMVPDDLHYRKQLAWSSSRIAADGLCLVGDAAGFIDPFYSPGMDWISFSVSSSIQLIGTSWAEPEATAEKAEKMNGDFVQSYQRWFEAIYENKYTYMGDFELMTLAFRLDLGLYYLGVVSQPYKLGECGLLQPPFTGPKTNLPFRIIRAYNRRLAAIARSRQARGTWGRKNLEHTFAFNSYRMDWTLPLRVLGAFFSYGLLEFREGWRSWFPKERPLKNDAERGGKSVPQTTPQDSTIGN